VLRADLPYKGDGVNGTLVMNPSAYTIIWLGPRKPIFADVFAAVVSVLNLCDGKLGIRIFECATNLSTDSLISLNVLSQ
jgi:hypothetical protein